MQFQLEAELKRAKERFHRMQDDFADADVELRTAHLLAESTYDMFQKVKHGHVDYKGSKQYDSDFCATEALWKQQALRHGGAVNRHYSSRTALHEAKEYYFRIDEQLGHILNERERWERADSRHRPDDRSPHAERWRTFTDLDTGQRSHFKQTFPPTPPRDRRPRSPTPPPRPRRRASYSHSHSPPPRSRRRSPSARRRSPSPPRTPSPPPPKRPTPLHRSANTFPAQSRVDNWFDSIDTALANPSTIRAFPRPPQFNCLRAHCPKVAVGLCRCCIGALFEERDWKRERVRFHPDKWARVPENVRSRVQADAGDVFKVVDEMWKDRKERGRSR